MDIINTGADLVRVTVLSEGLEQLHVTLRRLDRDDISIESLDGGEDIVEVRVAEVRVRLKSIGNTRGSNLEGGESPGEVSVPVCLAEGKTFTEGRLVDLNSLDASLLEIDDFIAEGKSELLALELTRNIRTREGPVENGDGTSQHTLHGLVGQALSEAAPLNGHGLGTADVRDDNGGTDVTRTVALHPGVLGEDEALKLLSEVLHHVVAFGLTVHEQVEADALLEADNALNLFLDELVVLLRCDLLLVELSASSTNFLGLLEDTYHQQVKIFSILIILTGKEPMVVVGNLGRLRV